MKEIDILNRIIKDRRSIFTTMFSGASIPDDSIDQILQNANWAPNHKKTEPWRFHIFCDEAKQRLSDYQKDYYLKHTPKEKISERKLKKTINNALKSSHVIALIRKRDVEKRTPEWEELAALSCAIQNMWLTVSAMGFGCYWSTPKSALEADEFLGLANDEKCYGWLYIGVPIEGMDLKGMRGNIEDKIKWVRK